MEKQFKTPEAILEELQRQVAAESEAESFSDDATSDSERGALETDSDSSSDISAISFAPQEANTSFAAPDGTVWYEVEAGSSRGRLSSNNIMRKTPGPTAFAKNKIIENSPFSSFALFVDECIIKNICECTTSHAREIDTNWQLDPEECYKFIALTYARGILGLASMNLKTCWDKNWGSSIFNKSMPRDRYLSIMKHLRFDKKRNRSERLQSDKFALASAIWNRFIENSRASFNPGESVTVDEQLYPMKCRCRFIQYMASKPEKFDLKYWMLADNKTKYLLNGFPYLGKDDTRPANKPLGEYVVLKLLEPFFGSGVNVTCDNYFTSVHLAEELKKHKISLVGTIRKNRREIPMCARINKDFYSTTIYKNQFGHTLTNYQAKKNKNVLILSTMHPSIAVPTDSPKKKPETIIYYNKNKVGIDILDSMCRKYSTRSSTRRWPIHVFFNILDLAAINSWILYKEVLDKKISRRKFIEKLVEEILEVDSERSEIMSADALGPSTSGQYPDTVQCKRKRRHCQIKKGCKNMASTNCEKCKKTCCGKCCEKIVFCKLCEP